MLENIRVDIITELITLIKV